MNGTPRLRSAYPSTPQTNQPKTEQYGTSTGISSSKVPLPQQSTAKQESQGPIIPLALVDAPSQRLSVLAFYLGLIVWRLWEYAGLVSDDTDSFQLFTKWVAIDGVLLYGLPGLKIPWLQWSTTTMTILFALHALLDYVLMFRVPIPLGAWLFAFTKMIYDRELTVSERRVKPANVLHNASLILGKQIIHILPEGSAMLNPNHTAYCLDAQTASIDLPVWINQTNPILIELLRLDLDTESNETLTIQAKEIQRLKKQAEKQVSHRASTMPLHLKYPVKQTGLYRLQRVVDDSKLEVQRKFSDTLVVRCPSAHIKAVPENRCIGDLSDFYIQVDATPPIQIKYSKLVNNEESANAVLSIPPKNPNSPLVRQRSSGTLVSISSVAHADVSWARSQSTTISVNESLGTGGHWQYSIDEIQDGCGNVVDYNKRRLAGSHRRHGMTDVPLDQRFSVYQRPRAALQGCDSQHALQVPKGKSTQLPLQISSTGSEKGLHGSHQISYIFTPSANLPLNQEHAEDSALTEFSFEPYGSDHQISEPGLYTLQAVGNAFCSGEILEPSSCLLSNPPEPDVGIETQTIPDRCAGNFIGLLVDLDLTGTPPFRLSYNIRRRGGSTTPKVAVSDLLHTQLELRPTQSGHYTYEFLDISDAVYREPRSLRNQNLMLEQDVRPPASARFLDAYPSRKTCIGEPVALGIQFSGEPPWRLDYELIYQGRRQKRKIDRIESNVYTITTEKLERGGEYSLTLTAVADNSGCKVTLEQETKIEVALQRPKAAFGLIEGQRSILALRDKQVRIPLRLQGEPPWTIEYRNLNEPELKITKGVFKKSNDEIMVADAGTYELIHVYDGTCPGNVDNAAKRFTVEWIPRPAVKVSNSNAVDFIGETFAKRDVCEMDEDAVELSLIGTPPFDVEYSHRLKPERGSQSSNTKRFTAGINLASIRMDTDEAGVHEYKITKLSDLSYSHSPRDFSPVRIEQHVRARPSAAFVHGGKTYKYCKEETTGGENIPIVFKGQPPFHLEIEVRHHASSKPELVTIPNIESHHYNLHISHRLLSLGTHAILLRKVLDANGCQRQMDQEAPRVQVNVAEVPSISALEARTDYCIGERISYMLSGSPPFSVFYTFDGQERKAFAPTTNFRRLAEKPGEFTITAVTDQRSADCRAHTSITKTIHEMPSVRVSKGRTATVDIHEGGEAEILFEFGGTPPFEFTYTRSSNPPKGKKSQILDTKSDVSHEYSRTILASDEGMYEVVAIKDRFCSFSTQKVQGKSGGSRQKLLT